MTVQEIIGIVNDTTLAMSTRLFALENLIDEKGNLDLNHTNIKELPENLAVRGNLDLNSTNIKELPEGLKVGGNIYFMGTNIEVLPEDIVVGGYVYTLSTKISRDFKKPKGVKGDII